MSLNYTAGDLETAAEVLHAAAQALIERGEELWPVKALTPARLERHYPRPSWRVAWEVGEAGPQAVGTYSLLGADPYFWPDDPAGEASYLHKLAVHPLAQGRGLSRQLLEHAAQESRTQGRQFLRLDTAANRPRLRALYVAAGFREVDTVQAGPWHVARFERKL